MKRLTVIFVILLCCGHVESADKPSLRERIETLEKENKLLWSNISLLKLELTESSQANEALKKKIERLSEQIDNLEKMINANHSNSKVTINNANQKPLSQSDEKSKPVKSPGTNPVVLTKPIFDIFLGEPLSELMKRTKVSASTSVFTDTDHPGKLWTLESTSNAVKEITVATFKGFVYRIDVSFVDASETNLKVLTDKLEETYGAKQDRFADELFGEKTFRPTIDGVDVVIGLNRDIGFMEDDKLTLTYVHWPLYMNVKNEIEAAKASKVKNQL